MEFHRVKILGFTLLLAGLALCGAGLWLLLSPAQYQATAVIKAYPTPEEIGEYMKAHPEMMNWYGPLFLVDSSGIRSEAVLSNVVSTLNLNREWSKKHGDGGPLETAKTIKLLQRQMRIEPVRNTELVQITFSSQDPNEAATIANAIAKAYQDYRLELQKQRTREGIQVLTNRYQKDELEINTNQESLDQLRKQLNVPNPEPADELLKSNYPAYFQTRRNLQDKIEFHKLLAAEIEQKKNDWEIPPTSFVTIERIAQPPKFPVSQDRSLGAVLLAIGLFPTVGGFLFLKSSRRSSA